MDPSLVLSIGVTATVSSDMELIIRADRMENAAISEIHVIASLCILNSFPILDIEIRSRTSLH